MGVELEVDLGVSMGEELGVDEGVPVWVSLCGYGCVRARTFGGDEL